MDRKQGIVAKALSGLVEQGRGGRTRTGKKGDPYACEIILSCSPQDSVGRAGRESENAKKPSESKEECSPRDFDLFSLRYGSAGREFLMEKVKLAFPGCRVIQDEAEVKS